MQAHLTSKAWTECECVLDVRTGSLPYFKLMTVSFKIISEKHTVMKLNSRNPEKKTAETLFHPEKVAHLMSV